MIGEGEMLDSNESEVSGVPGYWVYFLRVRGGALYCGIALDLERRLRQHATGRSGARYTKSRRPVAMVACWFVASGRGTAQRVEGLLKSLDRQQKLWLIENPGCIDVVCGKVLPKDQVPVPDLDTLSYLTTRNSLGRV